MIQQARGGKNQHHHRCFWQRIPQDKRGHNRFTTHVQGMEVVQLFPFTCFPIRPGAKLFELVTNETAKGLFLRNDGLMLDGVDKEVDLINRDIGSGELNT